MHVFVNDSSPSFFSYAFLCLCSYIRYFMTVQRYEHLHYDVALNISSPLLMRMLQFTLLAICKLYCIIGDKNKLHCIGTDIKLHIRMSYITILQIHTNGEYFRNGK